MLVYDIVDGTIVHGPAQLYRDVWITRRATLKHGMEGRPAVFTLYAPVRRGFINDRMQLYKEGLGYLFTRVNIDLKTASLRALPTRRAAFGEWIVLPVEYVFLEVE